MERLQILINNIIRLINGSRKIDHTSIQTLSAGLNWASINRLGISSIISDTWKLIHNDCENQYSKQYSRTTRAATKEDLKCEPGGASQFTRSGISPHCTIIPILVKSEVLLTSNQLKNALRKVLKCFHFDQF